jgi:integrase
MYHGTRVYVSCRELGTEPTKEASWKAANEWWRQKRLELQASKPEPPESSLEREIRIRKEWAVQHGRPDDAAEQEELLRSITMLSTKHPEIAERLEALVFNSLIPSTAVWQDRTSNVQEPPSDRTVGVHFDRWVKTQQANAAAGKVTPDRADNNRIALVHFRGWIGPSTSIDAINAIRLHDFYEHCLSRVTAKREGRAGWSSAYAGKVFSVTRSFIRSLSELDLIPLPKNIDSAQHKFGNGAKKIPVFTVEEFRKLFAAATGQLRLHLLLMANCGYCQTDCSDLKQSEVDWRAGRITRKRSKTSDQDDVPEVSYQLWPETFRLLREYRSNDPVNVLLTESGLPWVRKELIGGRLKKSDNIASNYAHLTKNTGIKKSLKLVRKTSAGIIESHEHFGRYKSHFLGHSPRSLADKSYAPPSVELFDRIVKWLGEQYGF